MKVNALFAYIQLYLSGTDPQRTDTPAIDIRQVIRYRVILDDGGHVHGIRKIYIFPVRIPYDVRDSL